MEIRYCEVLVQLDGALVALDLGQESADLGGRTMVETGAAYRLLVFTQSRIDDAHVEQDLGGVGDPVKALERLVELIVVVVLEGLDPCLYFLQADVCKSRAFQRGSGVQFRLHTCFNDMLSQGAAVEKAIKARLCGPWESRCREATPRW